MTCLVIVLVISLGYSPSSLGAVFALRPSSIVASQDDKTAEILEPGKPIERSIARREVHSYALMLQAGQYVYVRVEAPGVDVIARLFNPNGEKILETDEADVWTGTPEQLHFLAEVTGTYRLEISSTHPIRRSDTYTIRIKELRAASETDKKRVAAEKLFADAIILSLRIARASSLEAIKKYEEALPLFRALGDRIRVAKVISQLGEDYSYVKDKERALENYTKAAALWRELGNRTNEAMVVSEVGGVYFNLFGDVRKAREFFNQALLIARAANNPRQEAHALDGIGRTSFRLGDRRKSIEAMTEALVKAKAAGAPLEEAYILIMLATNYVHSGERKKALESYESALMSARAAEHPASEATALAGIGEIYSVFGDKKKALEYYNKALLLSENLEDPLPKAMALGALGGLHYLLGDFEKSIEFHNRAIPFAKSFAIKGPAYDMIATLALVYSTAGEKQKALELYNEALVYFRKNGERQLEGRLLSNMAAVYMYLGNAEKAEELTKQSLAICRAIFDRVGEALAFGSLGIQYAQSGRHEKAFEYLNEALLLHRALYDPQKESVILSNLGKIYFDRGDAQKALDYLNQSLVIKRKIGDRIGEAITLNQIGECYYTLLKDKEKARESFNQALSLVRATNDRFNESFIVGNFARMERDSGNLPEARKQIEAAIGIVENLRTKLASQELRASFFASMHEFYEFYIDLLMRMHKEKPSGGFDGEGLQASESARARALLETLTESRADIRQGVDPSLLERERSLQQQLNGKARRQMQILSGKPTDEESQAIALEIEEITSSLQEVKAEIRLKSPRYAALTQPQPLNLQQIQRDVLDKDTLLLEYSLGKEKSYLWAVSNRGIRSYELPGRAEIEQATRAVYDLLDARNRKREGETPEQKQQRIAEADKQYPETSSRLSQMILAPLGDQLKAKRLVIVADGALQYVPFGALPVPQKSIPLIVEHEIISLPSASTLSVLRREVSGRKIAPKAVAVLADPVYSADDERVQGRTETVKPATTRGVEIEQEVERAVIEAGIRGADMRIPRLPGTRLEAEQIASLVSVSDRRQALDFKANREAATNTELGQYRFLHFATHGFINSVHAELSGIMFSMVDEQGKPLDGFLRAHEIYNLNLPVELVVLSACQTGLGKEIKGEGLVGLTRGFMYAGAPRVVVSLWSVSDQATADLMGRFYRGMFKDKLRPAAALRMAQVEMLKQKRWQSPFYWAAFTLQGEWR